MNLEDWCPDDTSLFELLQRNFAMLDENPEHGWRIELGLHLAARSVRMEWLDHDAATVFWTDSRPCIGVPDDAIEEAFMAGVAPAAFAAMVESVVLEPGLSPWGQVDDLTPTTEVEEESE